MNSKLLLLAGLCALCVEGKILRGENGDTNDATLASKIEATRNPAAALAKSTAKSTANKAATALLISSSSNSPHSTPDFTPDPTRQLWRAARTYLKRSKRRQQQRAAATRRSTRRRRRHN